MRENMWGKISRKKLNYEKLMIEIVIIVSIVKFVLMGLFSSDYQNMMFIPFVRCFLEGNNPYTYYFENNLLYSFPYPPLMLWIESIGVWLIEMFQVENIFIINFLFKAPLLICDIVILIYLLKICGKKRKYILLLYFCSPIIIYSTFMHGQLDIIPTMFLVVSVFYLLQPKGKNTGLFTVALLAAIMTKFHIIAVVPLVYWYLYKKKGTKSCLFSLAGLFCGAILIVFPYMGQGFLELVLLNKEQATITNVYFDYQNVKLYLPIFAIMVVYLRVIQLNNMNRTLLMCLIGIIFSIFLITVSPMPGWYVWIVPFVLIYFVEINENRYKVLMQYIIFCFLYLIYFGFLHKTEYVDLYIANISLHFLKYSNELVRNIVFTMLTATLLLMTVSMYQFGIQKNSIYKRNALPFIIGIAGDSGTGKSELLNSMEALLGEKRILYIEGDGDHRWERGNSNWEQYTHLDPKANYLYRQARDLQVLRSGNAVKRVEYDHDTGKFTTLHRINPKKYIIMCGLHSLYLPQMRKALDLRIYLDTDENLRRFWKIRRDTATRGYSGADIVAQIDKRIPDAQRYIYPQKKFADLIICYFDSSLHNYYDTNHEVVLSVKLTMDIEVNLEDIIEDMMKAGIKVLHQYDEDLMHQSLIIDGNSVLSGYNEFTKLAYSHIEQFADLFSEEIIWRNGIEGIVQFFIVMLICRRM